MKTPYPHQEKAIQALFNYFTTKSGSPVGVAPVAAGKSLIMAEFMKRACQQYPSTNFIVLSHVSKLLTQNEAELKEQWPQANTSFYSDQLGSKDLSGQILFAGIQSIYKKAYQFPRRVDIVLIDECHLISPNSQTMYRRFLDDLLKLNPMVKFIGVSGSPYRAGQGYIHQGADRLFTDIAFNITMTELLAGGFLCPLVTPQLRTKMDVSGIQQVGGDFVQNQLQEAVDKDYITKACVEEIVQLGATRKKWIIFATGKTHAKHISEELTRHGISNAVIDADTESGEKALAFASYQFGDLRCLVNINCLTTGVNFTAIDLIAMMCPTRSPVKYVQTGGRGMRLHPGKSDCLYLDFGGIIESLGPIDKVRIKEPRLKKGEAPTVVCPECLTLHYAGKLVCECGYQFPRSDKSKINTGASGEAILSTQQTPLAVQSVTYQQHDKPGKPPSLKVTYQCGISTHHEWVFIEYGGWLRDKAVRWWGAHGQLPVPATVKEAIFRQSELKRPIEISVTRNGKYTEITNRRFSA